ncbi:MAG: CidA/LrgA family protein [Candidatus Dactylopiibacterium sp.]|nr:CidA/LrgA family protein [Candidatus Dactylopiibacterium sp.]
MRALTARLRPWLRVLVQIGLIVLIWLAAVEISARFLPGIPPTVSGIAIALALMALGLLRREWVEDGAAWLLREMLLFFIPVVIAVLQYRSLLAGRFLAILCVIVASTACVMLATAFTVDLAWKLEKRWRARRETQA